MPTPPTTSATEPRPNSRAVSALSTDAFAAAPELYEPILRALVDSGTALEINTSGLRHAVALELAVRDERRRSSQEKPEYNGAEKMASVLQPKDNDLSQDIDGQRGYRSYHRPPDNHLTSLLDRSIEFSKDEDHAKENRAAAHGEVAAVFLADQTIVG